MPPAQPAEMYAQLTKAFDQRAWPLARDIASRILPLAPHHPVVNYIAGIACMEMRQLPAALEYLRRAALAEPNRADFAVHFAKALSLARRNREAQMVADRARGMSMDNAALLDTLGVVFTHVGDYESASTVFHRATKIAPRHAPFRFNFATSLVAAGDIDAAEIELEACLALDPRHALAHLTLAQLRRQTSCSNHVSRLESILQETREEGRDNDALMCLNMALAKEYEDLADYARSFQHLVSGKTAGATGRHYSVRQDEDLFAAIMATFPKPSSPAQGHDSSEPIFIIGMPRSGTTLVERIVSSHPDVQSAGELLNFAMTLKHVSNSRTPALVDEQTIRAAGQPDWHKLGEAYLASTRPGTGSRPHFVDKLPHNFLYAGHIAHALPNAKIVCLRRDPLDTCLSNFRQLFAPKSPFFDYSFDLLDTGRYYILFDRLMAHWRKMLPGRILELDYEEIIDDQEASSRRLLEHCGLPWSDACLQFERNPVPVATASAVQVRAPIFRSSLQRWKKYESQLGPLRELLMTGGVRLDPEFSSDVT